MNKFQVERFYEKMHQSSQDLFIGVLMVGDKEDI